MNCTRTRKSSGSAHSSSSARVSVCMCVCCLLSKDQVLANISKIWLNSHSGLGLRAPGAWLDGENGMGLLWKHGLEHGELKDHLVQSLLVDITCFVHSASFHCSSGSINPISYGEPIPCDLNGADPVSVSQEWVLTQVWPIRELHFLTHSDWFRAGHMTQARPVRVLQSSLGHLFWTLSPLEGLYIVHCG